MMDASTLYDKLWAEHVVRQEADGTAQLYVDRHLLYEVTSPQAFAGLGLEQRVVWRPGASLGVCDHNVPTSGRAQGIADPLSRLQVETLAANCDTHGIAQLRLLDPRQGIVHVAGPEQGATLPGMTVVCGDSHTSTHGAFGALAFGIGTSEVEHVLATQTLLMKKSGNMLVELDGRLAPGCSAKDMALYLVAHIGADGGNGMAIEFAGAAVRGLSMEGRMTLCNMAIEMGARAGLVAVDDTTVDWLAGRPGVPQGDEWEQAVASWRRLTSDPGAHVDRHVRLDVSRMRPRLTWGTSPAMGGDIGASVPDPAHELDPGRRAAIERALAYMGLRAGQPLAGIAFDVVFIGSCTNSRIEDLRAAAHVVRRIGGRVAPGVKRALVVPGSGMVKAQAEREGLDQVFLAAGMEWREPGCSMCLAMNEDRLAPQERCASTSNRNFEGRQGAGGRTHLMSPAMAAAAAMHGHCVDVTPLFA
jgi:3-isopropylmalate/(R)-2-methylmalate dehydratase large subunit